MKKIYQLLEKPYAVILVMLLSPLLGFIDRNFVFFFALGIVFIILRKNKYDWTKFGLNKKINRKTIFKSLFIALILVLLFSIIDPVIDYFLGASDLSSLEGIKHNLVGYITIMVIMWLFAAFGEELLFRGYYMKGLALFLGNTNKAWLLSAFISSLYFGLSHSYQGLSGVVSVTLFSLLISMLFYKNKNNLLLLVFIHGIYDSIFITLLYLDKELITTSWVQSLL